MSGDNIVSQKLQRNRSFLTFSRLANIKNTEKLAVNYLLFRNPTPYFLILLPFIVGVYMFTIFELPVNSLITSSEQIQLDYIDRFLYGFQIALITLFSIFLLYRWNIVKQNGSYGYWIALGIDRSRFLIYSLSKFVMYTLISLGLGLFTIYLFSGFNPGLFNILTLLIQIGLNAMLLMSIGILLAEFVPSPSVATITFMMFNVITFIITQSNNIGYFFIQREMYTNFTSSLFSMLFSLLFAILIIIVAIFRHRKSEFDL